MTDLIGFSGSYAIDDVTFLMQRIEQPLVEIGSKERLIQSGTRHYSEMLSPEHAPSCEFLEAFELSVDATGDRLAADVLMLAKIVSERSAGKVVVVSLARAGTPIGVVLRRMLAERFGREVEHFSVSIIAGRGIDVKALDYIRARAGVPDESLVFVDGWTGKGVIGRELTRAVGEYNATCGATLDPTLHVIIDLCGSTQAASTSLDSLIPSALLGATISGLISRSILNADTIASGGFHGCRSYDELAPFDRSRPFVDQLHARAKGMQLPTAVPARRDLVSESAGAREATQRLLARYRHASDALLKPGLCESARVLLRRVPGRLIVRSETDVEALPLLILAEERRVPWSVDPDLPWGAAALISEVPQ
jgi:Phosphoribosyl transferase (PRTase)/PELOTA RNA binding domain